MHGDWETEGSPLSFYDIQRTFAISRDENNGFDSTIFHQSKIFFPKSEPIKATATLAV